MAIRCLLGLALGMLAGSAHAQVLRPPLPEKYDVHLRYRIRADRDERIRQFRAMEKHLQGLGFEPEKRQDADLDVFDPDAEILRGRIASANAARIFDDANIKTVILIPAGTMLPAEPKQVVQVRIGIPANLPARQQRIFHEQVVQLLGLLGFVEGVAYDHRGFSTIRGVLPAGHLLNLLKDLRTQPSGWLLPTVPRDGIPAPLKNILPIRQVEVLPDWPEVAAAPAAPVTLAGKLSPDVQWLLADAAAAEQPAIVEAVLERNVGFVTADLAGQLQGLVADSVIEGFQGNIATIRLPKANLVGKLAGNEEVRTIRLARMATQTVRKQAGGQAPTPAAVLKAMNLPALHALGYKGQGVRTVIVATEFDGLEVAKEETPAFPGLVKVRGKQLPAAWLCDLTGETSLTLEARPPEATRPGFGTPAAVALAAAAPEAAILLVRVHPHAYFELLTVARAVLGTAGFTPALQARLAEISLESDSLAGRRRTVVAEYQKAIADQNDDPIPRARREKAAAAMKRLQLDEAVLKAKVDRFQAIKKGLESLKGARLVVNTLAWDNGYPHDGLCELCRLIDESFSTMATKSAIRPERNPLPPVWVQAASMGQGQVWSGPFLDLDETGVMTFAPVGTKLPPQRWTTQLNFLQYAATDQPAKAAIPAGTKLRISLQWREPHDREAFLNQEPGFPIRLRLLKQIDPDGKTHASDDFFEVARSTGIPARLLKTPGSGTYEVELATTLPAEGVYALRVEGTNAFASEIAAIRRNVEIRPRIVVEILDPAQAVQGRVSWEAFRTPNPGVGLPGEASEAVAIGVGTAAAPACLTGAGPGIALRSKPETFLAGSIEVNGQVYSGTGVAAGYAAGVAACLIQAGVRRSDATRSVGLSRGEELVLPDEWLKRLSPARSPQQ